MLTAPTDTSQYSTAMQLYDIEQIARKAGSGIRQAYEQGVTHSFKGERQVVTEADAASEQFLRRQLQGLHDIPFYGEETGGSIRLNGEQWVVDPLDGTENMTGYPPIFGVSIGLLQGGEPVLGVVYDVMEDTLYSAAENEGAFVNGVRCRVSSCTDANRALLSVDISSDMTTRQQTMMQIAHAASSFRALKVFGAPVLSLAEVANGRIDLYFRPATKLPDLVAGVCLVREAGGEVRGYDGKEWTVDAPGIVAGNSAMIAAYQYCF